MSLVIVSHFITILRLDFKPPSNHIYSGRHAVSYLSHQAARDRTWGANQLCGEEVLVIVDQRRNVKWPTTQPKI